jgi:hypothetical protein
MSSRLALALTSSLLWLLSVAPVHAQPAGLTVSAPVTDATGATFTLTWGGGAFPWSAGYSDGSSSQTGTGASPTTFRLPYHASGAAAPGWTCVGPSATPACAGITVPAKPVTPPQPPVTSTHVLEYDEPSTNACLQALLCPTCTPPAITCYTGGTVCAGCTIVAAPLNDLATIRAYWRIDGGAEQVTTYPASGLMGGQHRVQSLTVPATSGTLTVAYAAVDLVGNEGARSVTVSKTIGAAVPGAPTTKPTITIRYQ